MTRGGSPPGGRGGTWQGAGRWPASSTRFRCVRTACSAGTAAAGSTSGSAPNTCTDSTCQRRTRTAGRSWACGWRRRGGSPARTGSALFRRLGDTGWRRRRRACAVPFGCLPCPWPWSLMYHMIIVTACRHFFSWNGVDIDAFVCSVSAGQHVEAEWNQGQHTALISKVLEWHKHINQSPSFYVSSAGGHGLTDFGAN